MWCVKGRRDPTGATAAQLFDYDNDGLVDLLLVTPAGPKLYRNVGDGWTDETAHVKLDALSGDVRSLALGDIDGDGGTDIVARLATGRVARLAQRGCLAPAVAARPAVRPRQQQERQPERGLKSERAACAACANLR